MEKRDLYNCKKELLNQTIHKDEAIPKDCYILIVVAIIQNKKGEFLIQKRSPQKDGTWALTGGHPKAGENSQLGMTMEIKEELGIDVKDLILWKEMKDHNRFCDLYYLQQEIDLNDVVLQKEEVSEVKWASASDIQKLYQAGKFKKGHYMMWKDFMESDQNNIERVF